VLQIKVLYFATLKQQAGVASEVVSVAQNASLDDLLSALTTLHPAIEAALPSAVLAVNREFADRSRRLQPGDEVLVNYEDLPFVFYTDARVRGGIAAFRAEDRSGPPRFLVLRRSVDFVHWPVFLRQFRRHPWRLVATGAPDVPFGNNPDPAFAQAPARNREIVVAELAR